MERVKICPECGEPIGPNENICSVCQYELTPEEQGLEPAAPEPAAAGKPEVPAFETPEVPEMPDLNPFDAVPNKPGKGGGSANGGETTIMSTGAVDNSSHVSNSDSHNTSVVDNSQTSNTVNNTSNSVTHNQTTNVFIIGGGDAPVPSGIDPQTAAAIAQAQQTKKPQKPSQPQEAPAEGAKGVGSIAGGPAFQPAVAKKNSGGGLGTGLIAGIIAGIVVIAGLVYVFSGNGGETPAPAPVQEIVEQPAAAPVQQPAAQPVPQPAAQPVAQPTAAPVATQPAPVPEPVKDEDFDLGMKAFDENDGLTALKYFEASYAKGNPQAKRMLYTIYKNGCGSVAKNELKAEDYE
ncbi:MAG: GlsB/YeaQ/YmgE family stress response membrane protein [Bacteroidales bacterium]|nr:GlsB/YeaQ/YmgE family stress response membrane protein [Bacteroidales bacterium]